jgi:hypothetical protein
MAPILSCSKQTTGSTSSAKGMNYTRDNKILLTVYFLFYYTVFLFFFLDDRLLSQYQPILFNYNRDLTELALIATGLPRWLIAHPLALTLADSLAFLLPAALLYVTIRKGRYATALGGAFVCFLALYFLLADIFWQMHHEPFILYLLLAFAFVTNREDRFYKLLEGCRYYFLYIFVSAAIWKIARGAVFNGQEMSRILLLHHSDLLTSHGDLPGEPCSLFSCRFYTWLINHPHWSYWLYLGDTLLEASFIIGFFTRRWDRLLIVLALVFVIADLLVMRIPYWSILLGTITLWPGRHAQRGRQTASSVAPSAPHEKKIVIYETTHHENLPALLDLSETHFTQIAVFLKELSYHHLSGQGSPAERWPRTEFFIQPAGCGNRRFIRQLFAFLRRRQYTHLHLSTLDNNLLAFAFRLAMAGPIHLSLTIHEVNEYFSSSFRTVRDISESIAKFCLRRQIRHYTFFLPAMAERFRPRLPEATTVFIPSRFYTGHPPFINEPGAAKPQPGVPAARVQQPGHFKIVIPGSIDPNRRNYAEVVEALTLHPLPHQLELVILGDSQTGYGAEIIAALQKLESPNLRLRFFKGYITETAYEQEIRTADVLWSPLRLHKQSSRNSPETYGQTTASGLTADLLLNNAPALAPAGFIIPEPFQAAILPYSSMEEALDIIRGMIADEARYRKLRTDIHLAFGYFSKDNFSAAFQELMELRAFTRKEKKGEQMPVSR